MAYIALGFLYGIPLFRQKLGTWLLAIVVASLPLLTYLANGPLEITTNRYLWLLRLGGYFAAGTLLYRIRQHVIANPWLIAATGTAATYLFVFTPAPFYRSLGPLPFAYFLLALGGLLPLRIGSKNDISYGIYIYAFPVQQMLAVLGVHHAGLPTMIVASVLCTIPPAYASWKIIEEPAQNFVRAHTRSQPARG